MLVVNKTQPWQSMLVVRVCAAFPTVQPKANVDVIVLVQTCLSRYCRASLGSGMATAATKEQRSMREKPVKCMVVSMPSSLLNLVKAMLISPNLETVVGMSGLGSLR